MRWIEQVDPEVAKAVRLETERQSRSLELIASENLVRRRFWRRSAP